MRAQIAQLSCGKGALELSAAVRLLPCVNTPVASERPTVNCCVLTARLITLVGLLACVLASGVYNQSSTLCSCVATALVAAVERLLPCMGSVVCC